MPGATRRSRRSAEQPPLTLGFAGSGELSAKATEALLDDLIDGRQVKVVYLPVTNDDASDEIVHVQRWCVRNEIPYEVVSDEADVKKDKTLKKIVEGAAGDYAASEQGAGKDIVELLASTEDEVVEDGRLLMFMDVNQEVDLDVFAHTEEHEVKAFDLCDNLSEIRHEGDGDDGTAPDPEDPPKDEVAERRGRRGRGAAAEEPPPADDKPGGDYTKAEQKEYDTLVSKDTTLVESKKLLKQLDPSITTEQLRGVDKAYVADLIIIARREAAEKEGGGDEAQASVTPTRRRRGAAAEEPTEPADGDDGAEDPKEAVFARLRGSREHAERIARGMSMVARGELDLTDDADEVEVAAGLLAAALMAFAEYLIVEVRKPKSAGRPRADGTEAQPKPPADPDAPKRGRGRPRKDAE